MTANPPALVVSLGVSRESWHRIDAFVDLLLEWQKTINLIASSTVAEIETRHVIDSLQLLLLFPPAISAFADLGSGGGFPALPMAIATGAHVHMFEANAKKAAFLREALRRTGAKGTVHGRLSRGDAPVPRVDAVTARALAPLTQLLEFAEPFIAAGATGYFHKGQDADAELTEARKYWRLDVRKHPSLTDSRAVILEVKEIARV